MKILYFFLFKFLWHISIVFISSGGIRDDNGYPRNPSTRLVLPDKETGMELYFYPQVHKWATSCTHRVSRCGCGYILPIPAGKINSSTICDKRVNCTLLVNDNLILIMNRNFYALLDY
jgi:hypothetical protein